MAFSEPETQLEFHLPNASGTALCSLLGRCGGSGFCFGSGTP